MLLAGVALGLALAACRASRPQGSGAVDALALQPADAAAAMATQPPRGKQIVIAYSSNLLGEYEPCG